MADAANVSIPYGGNMLNEREIKNELVDHT